MWPTVLLCVAVLYAVRRWWNASTDRGDLDRIPGPPGNAWWSLLKPQNRDRQKTHLAMTNLAKKYGPILKLPQLNGDTLLLVSSYELIYKVFVTNGKDFGGRSKLFRLHAAFNSTGILQNPEPDEKWRLLRRISQRHLRQFGDGLSRLENIITYVADEMFGKFAENEGVPYNPKEPVFDAAMNSIAFLISGERSTSRDPLVKKMRKYDKLIGDVIPTVVPLSFQLMDALPWLRHLGLDCWKKIQELTTIEERVWEDVIRINNANPESESIYKVFEDYMNSSGTKMSVSMNEARKTSLTLLFAGTITTATTFHCLINIIAHHPKAQARLYEEIENTIGEDRVITLVDRPKMHYCRAVILEVLRYNSLLPLSVAHRTCRETKLGEYVIPTGTRVLAGLYLMHHEKEFWGDPEDFRPERFLDEQDELLPADHPHRKHLMPFGAGTRVCLGESLALTRLFLWTSNLFQQYKVKPAPGNHISSCDSANFVYDGVLALPDYKIILTKRA